MLDRSEGQEGVPRRIAQDGHLVAVPTSLLVIMKVQRTGFEAKVIGAGKFLRHELLLRRSQLPDLKKLAMTKAANRLLADTAGYRRLLRLS
ncbi:hypothetical protein ACNJYD_08515 [Bradyrhizobium sp. DASA03005]|uniref:hypothetical protein n=1 Tax=Bradyrhizobium sp. SPXBL-02 TaxID=3395912 RepID=UPI003F6EAF2F